MEELNDVMVVDEIENEEVSDSESENSMKGLIIIGGVIVAAGVATAAFVASKKGKLNDMKTAYYEKKAKKLEKKLEKCYTTMNQEGEIIESDEDEE